MTEEKQKKSEGEFDIFIANFTYPEAAKIFSASLKSLNAIKDNCMVVLDTNALLVPFTTGKESLEQIRKTYKFLVEQKRLVVPGQVAREFAKNRAGKLVELFQQLNRRASTPSLQRGKYPLLESIDDYQESVRLEGQIDDLLRKYRETINKVLDHIRTWTWDDPVSSLYSELFTEDVVIDPPFDRDTVRTELTRRQIHGIPPGYKDSSKDDNGIGDFLIWQTILEVGKSQNKSVIFVSGEEKADWRYKSEGQTLYPRYELADEFRRNSGGESFHITQFSQFLDLYGATEKVVEEVRQKEQSVTPTSMPPFKGRVDSHTQGGEIAHKGYLAEQAAFKWLVLRYPDKRIAVADELRNENSIFHPDFVIIDDDSLSKAVDVVFIRPSSLPNTITMKRVSDRALAANYALHEGLFKEVLLIVVADDLTFLVEFAARFEKSRQKVKEVEYKFAYLSPNGVLETF
jgi:hypothetical protein